MTIQLLSNTLSVYINGVVKKSQHFPQREATNYIWLYFYAVFFSLSPHQGSRRNLCQPAGILSTT